MRQPSFNYVLESVLLPLMRSVLSAFPSPESALPEFSPFESRLYESVNELPLTELPLTVLLLLLLLFPDVWFWLLFLSFAELPLMELPLTVPFPFSGSRSGKA